MKKVKILLTILFLIAGFSRCEKPDFQNDNPNEFFEFSITEARMWIESENKDGFELKSGEGPGKKKYNLSGQWGKAKQYKNDKIEVIEVPLTSDEKFGFVTAETEEMMRNTGVYGYANSETRLFIQKSKKTGKITAHFMTIMGDPEYLDMTDFMVDKNTFLKKESDFIGFVLFHELDGTFNVGWKYTNGKLTHRVRAVSKDDSGLRLKQASTDCIRTDIYITTTWYHLEFGVEVIDSVESEYLGSYTVCTEINPGGGGGGPVIPADAECNCDVCPDCGGCMENLILKRAVIPDDGETGGSPTTETIVDCPVCSCSPIVDITGIQQNAKAYCIYQKLIDGGILSDFIGRYFAPSEQSHSLLGELNLTWTLGNTAETLPIGIPQNGAYYSVEIRLNESLINSGSATDVALIMLHEALHAKLIAEYYDEESTTDFLSLYASYKGENLLGLDKEQEKVMFSSYIDYLATALKLFDQSQGLLNSLDFYKNAIRYDLIYEIYNESSSQTDYKAYIKMINSIKSCN